MKKLISMTDYINQVGNSVKHISYEKDLAMIYNYCTFLKQPLTLGMFVPCDLDGNVFEKPNQYRIYVAQDYYSFKGGEIEWEKCKQYQQAKERVLFDGFTKVFQYVTNGKTEIMLNAMKGLTIEDLIKYNLTLSEKSQL